MRHRHLHLVPTVEEDVWWTCLQCCKEIAEAEFLDNGGLCDNCKAVE